MTQFVVSCSQGCGMKKKRATKENMRYVSRTTSDQVSEEALLLACTKVHKNIAKITIYDPNSFNSKRL